MTEHHTYWNW